jgi:hypothetical protein
MSRIEEGLKGSGIIAKYREVSQNEYAASRFAFDFTFEEGKEDEEILHVNDKIARKATGMREGNGMNGNVEVNELGMLTAGVGATA